MNKRLLVARPVATELEIFNSRYKTSISSDNFRVQDIINSVMRSDGKKIRPILLLLAAKACGEVTDVTYNSAITIELLHTASLIHDDVVDESVLRRGKPSLNAIYDNKISVLAGDYFLSSSLMSGALTGNVDIIISISDLGRNLAEGELNQLSLVKENVLDENEYFEVISKKTASLLSVCMKIGAISVNASGEMVRQFEKLGEYIGVCFQLKDDIFDYYSNNVGKPTGNDIKEGKVTLPLLFALKQGGGETDKLLEIIYQKDFSEVNIQKLVNFAKDNGGIEYAYTKIEEYKAKAYQLIDPLPASDVKTALYDAVDYVIEREY